jgi:hypothetical protein
MSMQHHNEGMSEELRKLFEDQKAARGRFSDQVAGRAKRTWSDGRLGATDDGDLAFAVGPHPEHELVVIDFGKPVEFVSMPPQQAIELAQTLIKHARAMATMPISITLH